MFVLPDACTAGVAISYPQQASVFVLPYMCTASVSVYNMLHLSCFAAVTSSTVQVSGVSIAMLILSSTKRLDELPPSSGKWCRYLLIDVFFYLLPFSSLIWIVDLFVFVKDGIFTCLSLPAKLLFIAGDTVGLWHLSVGWRQVFAAECFFLPLRSL